MVFLIKVNNYNYINNYFSTLSLIIIIASPQATSDAVSIQISYGQFSAFDPYNINVNVNDETKSVGFTGMVKRLVSIKELLDNQVCKLLIEDIMHEFGRILKSLIFTIVGNTYDISGRLSEYYRCW